MNIREELRAVCRAICITAKLDPKSVYEISVTPTEVTFNCYDLKDGKPYFNKQLEEVAKLPPIKFKIDP